MEGGSSSVHNARDDGGGRWGCIRIIFAIILLVKDILDDDHAHGHCLLLLRATGVHQRRACGHILWRVRGWDGGGRYQGVEQLRG